jgi:D-inositol-3-phosphate glycosyltransferase
MLGPRRTTRAIAEILTRTHAGTEFSRDSAVLFATRFLRERTEQRSPLALPDRRAVVYGGIDERVFTPCVKQSFSWRLLFAGRVEPRKGVHVAVEAMADLPDRCVLDIVGSWDDEYVASLYALADRLAVADRVRFHGQLPRGELARRIGEADVFVFPVVWEEPFGMAPLEAMACGTPVVGTATGGSA